MGAPKTHRVPYFRPRSDHACPKKLNPSRETVSEQKPETLKNIYKTP
jgi:hypothetical protein